ncbi:hypothetical protein FOA52_004157 [Chlamydomonas sp. UWO 241]|nr:hypothetical protein FOA52_004157 [Chlamydomonas sp. UWO 241]
MAIIETFPQLEGRSKENLCVEMVRVVLGIDMDEALLRTLIAEAVNISKGEYKINVSSCFSACFFPK